MKLLRLRAFGLRPAKAANDNRTAPETLSVVLDTWLHRYLGRRDCSITLEELVASNILRDTYTLTEAS